MEHFSIYTFLNETVIMVVYYFVYILQITLLSFYVMIQYYCIVHTGLKSEKNLNTNLKKYFKNMLGR